MPKRSKGQAIILGKCPQCREGNLFQSGPYQLKKFTRMHTSCNHCGVNYTREPRFFDGAMYISYAMSVGLFLVTAFLVYSIFDKPPVWVFMVSITTLVLLFYPLMFRYSRILYLYAFGGLKYRENAGDREKQVSS